MGLTGGQAITRIIVAAFVAIALILTGWWKLSEARQGLSIESLDIAGTPATIFRPASGVAGPVVIIAHGFAGSQQLMQPLAVTLAQSGYIAITYDLLGHGRSQRPMSGSLTDLDGATRSLVGQLQQVADFGRTLAPADKIGVLGHSMASDIVVRFADEAPGIAATVALSMFSTAVTPGKPANLLVIVGALEPSILKGEALRVVEMQAGGPPEPGRIYGDFGAGTARKASFSAGVEHIGVLYSAESLIAARDWFNLAFERKVAGPIDSRGLWLALLFGGLVLLGYPLAQLLPVAAGSSFGPRISWPWLLPLGLVPAIATPLLLFKLPTDFLPILLGDYLALHFLVFGLILILGTIIIRRLSPRLAAAALFPAAEVRPVPLIVATLLGLAYCVGLFDWALDTYVVSFAPTAARLPIGLAVLACLIPYFLIDAWLTAGKAAPMGSGVFTKLCFLGSLAIAVALNPQKLFFLIIIIPAMLIVFTVYGLFSSWIMRRTGHPAVGALVSAAAIAYAIGVTFPMVTR